MNLNNGTTLQGGKYRIIKTLGAGGFGITYLAVHTLLDKPVAVKEFFPKDFCDRAEDTGHVTLGTKNTAEIVEKLRAKFIKEARNIAMLDHPGIVKGSDVFEENNTAYFVMDYIDGHSLADIIAHSGPMPPGQAVAYIEQVADALAYLHARKMNHLDVKPANIMVRNSDGRAVLIDFGLAKHYDTSGEQSTSTPVGLSHGYAPPEQYKAGGVSSFSPATDIYSLGATLYKLLTGITPPEAMELMDSPLMFPGNLPPAICAAVEKSMSTSRQNRFPSVAAFLDAIHGRTSVSDSTDFSAGGGVTPPPGQTIYPTGFPGGQPSVPRPPKRKNTAIWVYLGVAAVAAIIAAVIYSNSGKSTAKVADTDEDTAEMVAVAADSFPATENAESQEAADEGAPLSEGGKKDGLGGFDDNAEGYFQMHADEYMTENRDVYFDGYFYDSSGKYPINLKFEFDDNYFPGVCYYTNVDYNTKLKMSVRFTEEEMIISGNAGGSPFTIRMRPGSSGSWSGTAQNGKKVLNASIHPIAIRR